MKIYLKNHLVTLSFALALVLFGLIASILTKDNFDSSKIFFIKYWGVSVAFLHIWAFQEFLDEAFKKNGWEKDGITFPKSKLFQWGAIGAVIDVLTSIIFIPVFLNLTDFRTDLRWVVYTTGTIFVLGSIYFSPAISTWYVEKSVSKFSRVT